MITDPIQTQRALLAWQAPLSQHGPRRRFAVAELVEREDHVVFSYRRGSQDIEDARDEGFDSYPGLPVRDYSGDATAFRLLRRRLPPATREDFREFLEGLGLSPKAHLTDLSLLAYTGARLTGDGFGIVETFDGFDRPFQYVFDIAGFRQYRAQVPDLTEGEPVTFRSDSENQYGAGAVEVVCRDGVRLGFINRLQMEPVRAWLRGGAVEARVFRDNGRAAYPRLFVLAQVNPGVPKARAA